MTAYSKLSLSNKIELFRLDDKREEKRKLIEKAAEMDMTVIEMRDEIKEYLDTEPPLEAQEYIPLQHQHMALGRTKLID
jgi:hypothetical protein